MLLPGQLPLPGMNPKRWKSSGLRTCPACGQHDEQVGETLKFLYCQQRLSSIELANLYGVTKHLKSEERCSDV